MVFNKGSNEYYWRGRDLKACFLIFVVAEFCARRIEIVNQNKTLFLMDASCSSVSIWLIVMLLNENGNKSSESFRQIKRKDEEKFSTMLYVSEL